MAYERPMVTVKQNMTITPTSVERDQPAFIFGPHYELHRYSDEDEKSGTSIGSYSGSAVTKGYPSVADPKAVDKNHDYTKLFGDNVVAELFNLGALTLAEEGNSADNRATNGGYTMLMFNGKAYVEVMDGSTVKVQRESGLKRDVKVGDTLLVSYKESGSSTSVKTLVSVSKVEYVEGSLDIDGDSTPDITEAGTLVTVSDAIPETVDSTSVSAKLVCVMDGVQFEKKNISAGSGYQWSESDNGVTVNAGLKALVSGYGADVEYCNVLSADLFVEYRELNTTYSDSFHSVTGISDMSQLGTVDKDNPLAMGVYMAALNAATDDGAESPVIYFMSVPSDDIEGYNKVLGKATLTDKAYVFAPTTMDGDVIEALGSHVESMSTASVKMWRIGVVSKEVESESDVLDGDYYAIPVADGGTQPGLGKYNKVRIVTSESDIAGNPNVSLRDTVAKGDKVRLRVRKNAWKDGYDYDEYNVVRVLNNYTVEIDGYVTVDELGHGGGSYKPSRVEIVHVYTPAQKAELVAKASRHLGTRRLVNVFPNEFERSGVEHTGEFAACAVAGLISATEPQQPITNVSLSGIDEVPLVYKTYTGEELDTMAEGGTFIVAQDTEGDKVYVRHQVTTVYSDGNLNTGELSVTRNVDSISYAFADLFEPYYGKYNITPDLIAIFENLAGQLISQLGTSTSVYGPQLITEGTEIRYVKLNELYKDHVDIAITLEVPYPCNRIDIVLTV